MRQLLPFAGLLKQWIVDADHPGVAQVHTNAELGRWETPGGVTVTLTDHWSLVFQTVGGAPVGGGARPPSAPAESWTPWDQRPEFLAARNAAETAATRIPAPARNTTPALRVSEVTELLIDAAKRADHPTWIATVGVTDRGSLRVVFDDDHIAWTFPVGVVPPGSTTFNHPVHQIPKGYA